MKNHGTLALRSSSDHGNVCELQIVGSNCGIAYYDDAGFAALSRSDPRGLRRIGDGVISGGGDGRGLLQCPC
jgi:hypothetical protein